MKFYINPMEIDDDGLFIKSHGIYLCTEYKLSALLRNTLYQNNFFVLPVTYTEKLVSIKNLNRHIKRIRILYVNK